MLRSTVMAGVLAAVAATGFLTMPTAEAEANPYSHRQYYSSWNHHSSKSYYYRTYYYKPTPTYSGYRHHYAVYYPSRPKHYYYYNPYQKQYWGRCPIDTKGVGTYSHLAKDDQRGKLEDIPEKAFPAPGKLPPMPEAKDDATLDLPPDDLPPGVGTGDTPAPEKDK